MIQKRITGLALLASLLSLAVPANAATVNGSVTVKWNTQVSASLTLNTNYSATGAQQLTAPAITTQANAGTGSCTAAGAGSEVAGTVNFGNVTPDGTGIVTDCQYQNGVNAQVGTSSVNWSLTEALALAPPAGSALCAYANDASKSFPFPNAATYPATQTQYGGVAVVNATLGTCSSSGQALTTTAFNVTPASVTHAFTGGTFANLGEDVQLQLNNTNATGANTATINYVLVAN